MSNQMKSYPTRYKDQLFRSRLEAKWAAFFDLLGWPYVYEPYDLNGYIPDFILQFYEPLLVEVKPEVLFKDLEQHTGKIEKSGWDKEILIVGADLFSEGEYNNPTIGLLGEYHTQEELEQIGWPKEEPWHFVEGMLFYCNVCKRPSILHHEGSFHCRVTGCYEGNGHIDYFRKEGLSLWRQAGNEIQWNPNKNEVNNR